MAENKKSLVWEYFEFSTLHEFLFNIYLHWMDYAFLLLQLQ